jgi:hypothetical protein
MSSDSDEEQKKEQTDEQIVISELLREGKCNFKRIKALAKKRGAVVADNNLELSKILKKIADVMKAPGKPEEFIIKDEYRKTIPSHGARIDYNK